MNNGEEKFIEEDVYSSIVNDCQELLKLLISTINTSKKNKDKT